jgi:hypothetical protein
MDRRYKHLNGEERGMISAEHRRGASLRAIGSLLGRSASTIGRELVRGRGLTATTARRRDVVFMMHDGCEVGDLAGWSRAARFIPGFMVSWCICTGRQNRLRAGLGSCIPMILISASAMRRSMPRSMHSRAVG